MPFMPARVKYRRMHRGSRAGMASRATKIDFGTYGLQTLDRAWLTTTQLEAARVALTRSMKRKGKVWIRVFCHHSVSKKPLETRMGKGKGAPEIWVAVIRPGNVLFEMDGVPENTARESFALAAAKLPFRTRFIARHQMA
jgi:large subunit ribosomal protein L16